MRSSGFGFSSISGKCYHFYYVLGGEAALGREEDVISFKHGECKLHLGIERKMSVSKHIAYSSHEKTELEIPSCEGSAFR